MKYSRIHVLLWKWAKIIFFLIFRNQKDILEEISHVISWVKWVKLHSGSHLRQSKPFKINSILLYELYLNFTSILVFSHLLIGHLIKYMINTIVCIFTITFLIKQTIKRQKGFKLMSKLRIPCMHERNLFGKVRILVDGPHRGVPLLTSRFL